MVPRWAVAPSCLIDSQQHIKLSQLRHRQVNKSLVPNSRLHFPVCSEIDSTGRSRGHGFSPYRNLLLPYDPVAPDGEHFPEFIATEVAPRINSRYRIAKGREHTGIGGSSLGATAALYTVFHRADMFGLELLKSTSLQLGNGQLIGDTSPIVMGPIRALISVGTEELGADISNQRCSVGPTSILVLSSSASSRGEYQGRSVQSSRGQTYY